MLACVIVLLIGLLISVYRENTQIKDENAVLSAANEEMRNEYDYDSFLFYKSKMQNVEYELSKCVTRTVNRSMKKIEMLSDEEYLALRMDCQKYAYTATVLFPLTSFSDNEDIKYVIDELYDMTMTGELYLAEDGPSNGMEIAKFFGSHDYYNETKLNKLCNLLRNREKFEG